MSIWTHVRGVMKLYTTPYETKAKGKNKFGFGNKKVYLPFPEEQFKVGPAQPDMSGSTEPRLMFPCTVYSLPKARKYIEKAISLLPQGESRIDFRISQTDEDGDMSSSCFDYPCEFNAFYKALCKRYHTSIEKLDEYYHVDIEGLDTVSAIHMSICDGVRYCEDHQMLDGFRKMALYLREHDIDIEDAYVEWRQDFAEDYYYVFKSRPNICGELFRFEKIDYKTNKIVWRERYMRPLKKKSKYDCYDVHTNKYKVVVEEDENGLENNL